LALTEHHDLRTGNPPWDDARWDVPASDALPDARADVAIIGAGISGSIIAERLSETGMSVLLLDRRAPGLGSTAASTAQVMWAMDVPLSTLAADLGFGEAARRWRRVYRAVRGLAERMDVLGIDGEKQDCPTVYLEGPMLDADALTREAELHRKAGLPSEFLDAGSVASRFGIATRAAIVSSGGFSIDPVKTAHGMLEVARAHWARICHPVDVVSLTSRKDGVSLSLAGGGVVEAGAVILASGYERAALFLPPAFSLLSTFVMATAPGVAPAWRENAMIWEAADPYLYLRSDTEGRIIAGGEDIEFAEERTRDALIGTKAGTIAAKSGALLQGREIAVERAWAAMFGSSPDGLPAIGQAATMQNVWLAAGFGGNGIAFSALAAELLTSALTGNPDPDADAFDPYRFNDSDPR